VSRVLFVSTFLSAGMNRGYTEDLVDRLEARGVSVHRTSARPNRIERLVDMVRTTVARRRDFDVAVVDVFSGAAFVWAEAVCFTLRRLGKPYILTLHGGNLPAFAQRWPRRVGRLLASAERVTAPSNFMREQLRGSHAKIVLLRNAVDARALVFAERVRVRPRLIWVRAFHAVYNPVMAVEALALAARTLPDLALVMIGPDKGDDTMASVVRRARELGIADKIEIVGPVPKSQVPARLAEADVFINTTNIDNTPVSVLEAMASGLCVISTAVGGIPYLLEHEQTALLVPRDDAPAMAAAIERLMHDPELAQRLSCGARAVALEHDWNTILDGWQRMLAEVAHA
jgi:glycosyltransferase involved in cell wall biosynthesis